MKTILIAVAALVLAGCAFRAALAGYAHFDAAHK